MVGENKIFVSKEKHSMKKASRLFSLIALCALMFLMTACGGGGQTFAHGKISGSSYTSDFLKVKATFSSEWMLYTDSQLAAYNKMSDMSSDSIKSKFKQDGTIYDMVVARSDGASMNVVIQDTTKTGKMEEDMYFTTGLELLKIQLESTGAKTTLKADSISFLGQNTRCIKVTMSMNGLTMYMIQIPIFKGDYIASITFGSRNEADLPGLVAMFKSI